ncbi:MAG: hypothetical protein QF734_11035 [Arenicellales bacterium]|nr:hypothetical protein [Arenicellales bacterium]MDP7119095.1 hypothetical protein [Arenicellales bacterium]MDP7193822.1 hypothetical protein [Arenicellales bacterium]MDP7490926.1 hypothetical protein [Arenicellales bacterium]MDP7563089.1 hypothetical protein [Arenicellales bacterium]
MRTTVQSIIGLVALLTLCSSGNAQDISMRYGFVGKHEDHALFVIDEGAPLKSGVRVKLNFEYPAGAWLYVCYLSSNGIYSLLFTSIAYRDISSLSLTSAQDTDAESVYGSLGWLTLDQNTGTETFFLIASVERLQVFEKLISNYDRANGKSRKRFAKRISQALENLPSQLAEAPNIQFVKRLEKPVIGGATFRELTDDGLSEHSLSHEATGTHIIHVAFTIDHQ